LRPPRLDLAKLSTFDRQRIVGYKKTARSSIQFLEMKPMAKSSEKARATIQSMITLAGAALGLVCALAWNEAIRAAMKEFLGEDDSIPGLFTYAVLATIIAIVVLMLLGRASARVGGEAAIEREAEG
jgi:uncharacterized membrane protein YidH (DUF202 family)